jgi:hypothetical protein
MQMNSPINSNFILFANTLSKENPELRFSIEELINSLYFNENLCFESKNFLNYTGIHHIELQKNKITVLKNKLN